MDRDESGVMERGIEYRGFGYRDESGVIERKGKVSVGRQNEGV